MKRFIKSLSICLLAVYSLIYFSCYAYYEIPKEDLIVKKNTVDRIRLKDKTEIHLQSSDSLSFNPLDSLVLLKQDSVHKTIKMAEIDKFMRAEYNLTKTIVFIFGLLAAAFGIFLLVMSGYNPGG